MTKKKETSDIKGKARIMIVDDHPIVRHGMALLINRQPDMMVCGEATNASNALKCIPSLNPHVIVIDISLQGMDGIELIKHIKARHPRIVTLVVSMHDESLYAERVLRAGALGYVMKQEANEDMIGSIRRVLNGEIAVSEAVASGMLHRYVENRYDPSCSPMESLSDRELEVFRLIGHGHPTRQIADELHLSIKTIEAYREHIKQKLQLKNGTELIRHAVQWPQSENEDNDVQHNNRRVPDRKKRRRSP